MRARSWNLDSSCTVVQSAGFLCMSYRRGLVIGHSAEVPASLLVGAGFLASDIQGLVSGRSPELQPGVAKGDYEAVLLAVHPLCPVGLDGGGDEPPREFAGAGPGPPRQPGKPMVGLMSSSALLRQCRHRTWMRAMTADRTGACRASVQ